MRLQLALLAAKLTTLVSTQFKLGSGTSLPGKVAKAIDPNCLSKLAKALHQPAIAVTGTNGKTTTASLLSALLAANQTPVVHNHLGANMLGGVTAALVQAASLAGEYTQKMAVLEVDEASFQPIAKAVPIARTVVTNLFRDQLDRYGELDTTAKLILKGVAETEGRLILNADDPLVAAMGVQHQNALYFGIEQIVTPQAEQACPVDFPREVTDCPVCGASLHYDWVAYGHLGHYACTQCEFKRPKPSIYLTVEQLHPKATSVTLFLPKGEKLTLKVTLPGVFNLYNLLGAVAAAVDFGLLDGAIQNTLPSVLSTYQGIFGRSEQRQINGKPVHILLIKNPVGASEVLRLVANDPKARVMIAINDNYADGRDISWLWDAQFERLTNLPTYPLIVSGTRADDMAVRLQYAGLLPEHVQVIPNLADAVLKAATHVKDSETLYLLPTYTALLSLKTMFETKQLPAA